MLFGDLELTRIEDLAIMISQLIDVDTPAVVIKIDGCAGRDIFLFINHLAKEIIYLHVAASVRIFLKIKSYE